MKKSHLIALDSIQKELSLLKDRCQKGEQERACLFNVIIYANNQEQVQYFKDLALKIMQQFPCQIIFIKESTDESQQDLKIRLSNETAKNNHQITGQEIEVEVSLQTIERIPFLPSLYLHQKVFQ